MMPGTTRSTSPTVTPSENRTAATRNGTNTEKAPLIRSVSISRPSMASSAMRSQPIVMSWLTRNPTTWPRKDSVPSGRPNTIETRMPTPSTTSAYSAIGPMLAVNARQPWRNASP
jgi:hypothetical protein